MTCVIERVEADEVAVKQHLENLFANGERLLDLGGREGAVKEESHPDTVKPSS